MVTQNEVIDELMDLTFYAGYHENNVATRIKAEGIAPPVGYAIVPIENCQKCDNTGKYKLTAWMPEKSCSCLQLPQSRYNQNKAAQAAAQKENASD